jgi:L-threonylcarbamoyladenylate synthase
MPVVPANELGLQRAVAALRAGQLVGLPTETVYGLAADARNPSAIARVFEAKGRPLYDPLILHVAPGTDLGGWVHPDVDLAPLARFWPGPLTVVVRRDPSVHDLITAGLDTVAVRVPAHPVAQALLAAHGPVVAPSANRFGRISPTRADAVIAELGEDLLVLDGGPCDIGVESTIVRVGPPSALLRSGGTPREALEAVLGPLATPVPTSRPEAPGQLASHYAPRTPVSVVDDWSGPVPSEPIAVLEHVDRPCPWPAVARIALGPSAADVAQGLYQALRDLDAAGADRIVALLPADDHGLHAAIRDRLTRAAAPPDPAVG